IAHGVRVCAGPARADSGISDRLIGGRDGHPRRCGTESLTMSSEAIAPQTNGGPPQGEPLLTTDSYELAVAAVDALADARFPVARVTIVGHGVSTVEEVTGGAGYARALGTGALNGAFVGLFFGLLFDWWGALTPSAGWGWLALLGLIYGAVLGGLIGFALYGFYGGHREFASASSLPADRYEVLLAGGNRGHAVGILRDAGMAAAEAA